MTEEMRKRISSCYVHLRHIEIFLELGQPFKSEFHSRELSEQAKLLSNELYYIQRRSGEVK